MKNHSILAMLAFTFNGCEEPIDYRYADLPRPVECEGVDLALLHEALYSFQQDIGNAYNFRNFDPAEPLFVIYCCISMPDLSSLDTRTECGIDHRRDLCIAYSRLPLSVK